MSFLIPRYCFAVLCVISVSLGACSAIPSPLTDEGGQEGGATKGLSAPQQLDGQAEQAHEWLLEHTSLSFLNRLILTEDIASLRKAAEGRQRIVGPSELSSVSVAPRRQECKKESPMPGSPSVSESPCVDDQYFRAFPVFVNPNRLSSTQGTQGGRSSKEKPVLRTNIDNEAFRCRWPMPVADIEQVLPPQMKEEKKKALYYNLSQFAARIVTGVNPPTPLDAYFIESEHDRRRWIQRGRTCLITLTPNGYNNLDHGAPDDVLLFEYVFQGTKGRPDERFRFLTASYVTASTGVVHSLNLYLGINNFKRIIQLPTWIHERWLDRLQVQGDKPTVDAPHGYACIPRLSPKEEQIVFVPTAEKASVPKYDRSSH